MTSLIKVPMLCARHAHLRHFVKHLYFHKPESLLSTSCLSTSGYHKHDYGHKYLREKSALHTSAIVRAEASGGVNFPTRKQVVICGGGVIGTSVAYHLALAGWTDVVLLEQGSISCGTSWHAAGLVGRPRGSAADTAIVKYSADLYRQLEEDGYGTGWRQCGSLNLCRTMDRLISYKRTLLQAERFGIESEFLTPNEIKSRFPLVKVDDIEGGYFIPGDGIASPTDVCMALSKKAKEAGVQIVEGCKVLQVHTNNERVCGVETEHGSIDCEYFVNTAGQWSRDLGQLSDPPVRVPLHACEHFYIVTKPMQGMDQSFPVVRDYDGYIYMREYSGGILGGGFEPVAKPVFHEGVPDKFEFQLLPEDWDHFQIILEQLLHRVPSLAEAEVRQMINGPESFTPDGRYILGEAPEVDNYFVAAGMNSSGIAAAGGVGKFLAEWITTGETSMDFWSVDIRRFVDLHNNKKFLRDRVKETLGMTTEICYWDFDMVRHQRGRKLRMSLLFSRTESKGKFGQSMGYERPLYFNKEAVFDDDGNDSSTTERSFGRSRDQSTCLVHSASPTVHFESSRRTRMTPLYPRLMERGANFNNLMGFERASHFVRQESHMGLVNSMMTATEEKLYETSRNLRMAPMYPRMQALGAVCGEIMGFERPLWFVEKIVDTDDYYTQRKQLDEFQQGDSASKGSFGKPSWFDKVRSEYWACREGVCLIDMSTFSKFVLRSAGTEVVDFLQHVCSNDVDRPTGSVIHTGMHNHRGGYENDCSLVRMADNSYFMISPTAQQTRAFKWLKKHLPSDGSVQLSDVTSMYTAINVIGPKARELLAELTDAKLGSQDFMHMTCKLINVGQASGIKAMRLTHSGEDGWMLYIPSEYALHVYDSLMEAGKNYGVRNAGYYALRALRTEKFFAYWGTDLTPFVTPLECGREYRVKFDRGGFIGYPALLRQRSEGIKKKLLQFLLVDHDVDEDPWPWGGEPIYRNGKYCGLTTSTAYGFTLDRHVCLGYIQDFDEETNQSKVITNDFILKNASFEVDIAGKRFAAKAGIYPPKLASAAIVINPMQNRK